MTKQNWWFIFYNKWICYFIVSWCRFRSGLNLSQISEAKLIQELWSSPPCVPATQACRDTLEFSEELTIGPTPNASPELHLNLRQLLTRLWSAVKCRRGRRRHACHRTQNRFFSWNVTSFTFCAVFSRKPVGVSQVLQVESGGICHPAEVSRHWCHYLAKSRAETLTDGGFVTSRVPANVKEATCTKNIFKKVLTVERLLMTWWEDKDLLQKLQT